jgi:hypothetical protein
MDAKINGKADAWRQRIDNQRSSGQSIRAWCRQNRFAEHAFYWWRAKLGLSARTQTPDKPLAFAQVMVQPSTAEPIRLQLSGQRELVFPATMPVEQVARLVHAIEATA